MTDLAAAYASAFAAGAGPAAPVAGRHQQGDRLTPDELRTLFLFEELSAEQLGWISTRTRVQLYPAGATVYAEGDDANCFYVLLSGTVALSRRVAGDDVEITRTEQRGAYGGATTSFVASTAGDPHRYPNSMRAITDAALIALPARELTQALQAWFPMAMHLVEGMLVGMRNSQVVIGQREQLAALGALTAGLTHELNNPAAAAVRATGALRERVAGMRHKLALLAGNEIDGDALKRLTALQEDAVDHVRDAPTLSPLEEGDREDEVGEWLDDHDVQGAWELAPVFVAAGLTPGWLEQLPPVTGGDDLNGSVRWLAYSVETEMLMAEIEDATRRISTLVQAAKNYSHMDRAGHEEIDVHEGLKSTLVMLTPRLRGVKLVKEFDRTLPKVLAFPGELNQVWTNLVDNAASAMGGSGTLTVRTTRDGDMLLVEVCDTGPGVPRELQRRIFEPFFTTKGVGEGTGLGLDISWKIVVNRHGGDLRVVSKPGDTRFQVRLPLTRSAEAVTQPSR